MAVAGWLVAGNTIVDFVSFGSIKQINEEACFLRNAIGDIV